MPKDSTPIRISTDAYRLARIAAAASRETIVTWVTKAIQQRLDRENRLPARFKVREVSVTFTDFLGSQTGSDSTRRR